MSRAEEHAHDYGRSLEAKRRGDGEAPLVDDAKIHIDHEEFRAFRENRGSLLALMKVLPAASHRRLLGLGFRGGEPGEPIFRPSAVALPGIRCLQLSADVGWLPARRRPLARLRSWFSSAGPMPGVMEIPGGCQATFPEVRQSDAGL